MLTAWVIRSASSVFQYSELMSSVEQMMRRGKKLEPSTPVSASFIAKKTTIERSIKVIANTSKIDQRLCKLM